jgi:hypothetical protein
LGSNAGRFLYTPVRVFRCATAPCSEQVFLSWQVSPRCGRRPAAPDLRQQNATAIAARDLLTEVRKLADDAATLSKEIDARLQAAPSDGLRSARERLSDLARRLVEDSSGRYPMPQLVEQAEYLYRLTRQSDQKLGRDVTERLEELRAATATATAELAAIRSGARPA